MLKNSELKVYGLTQNITTNEYMMNLVLKEISIMEIVQIATDITHRQLGVKHVILRKLRKDGRVEIRKLMTVLKNFNSKPLTIKM